MNNVIIRNILRLIGNDNVLIDNNDSSSRIEPMSEWKWNKLYETAKEFGIGPWIAEGVQRMEGDFFLQPSSTLHQQLLDLKGDKDPEHLQRFLLQIDRSHGLLHHLKRDSLRAYVSDLINAVKNVEE